MPIKSRPMTPEETKEATQALMFLQRIIDEVIPCEDSSAQEDLLENLKDVPWSVRFMFEQILDDIVMLGDEEAAEMLVEERIALVADLISGKR